MEHTCCLQDWSYQQGAKLRQLLSNLQRVTRRTIHAKCLAWASIYAKIICLKPRYLQLRIPSQVNEDGHFEEALRCENGVDDYGASEANNNYIAIAFALSL